MTNILAIYCRTSKNKETGKDYSIESQKQGGLKLAMDLGIGHTFYVDEGISGTLDSEDRPAFAQMIGEIKSGRIKTVYCIDQSRIERNTDIWRFFVALCINNKCKYYPNGKEFNLEDEESMLLANVMSLFNSFYAKITSRKVKLANYNKAKKGKTHGLKSYGLNRDENNNYVIFEDEAKNIRRMFVMSLQGIGTYTIANIFNEEGVPTKYNRFEGVITRSDKYTKRESYFEKANVKWRGNVIYDMLRNEIYKGIRSWKDLRIPVPAIVSEELWQKVNDNLSKNKKNVGKKAKYHYLLNGLIYCGNCQSEVIGKKRLKGNDNAYKCKGKRPPHKNCSESRGISLPKLETFIIQHLFYDKGLKQLLAEAPKNNNESLQARKNLEQKEAECIDFKRNIERLAKILKNPDLKNDENFTLDYIDYKEKLKKNEAEIEELTLRIAELENGDRNKRSKYLIESYTTDIGFDEVKRLVHSLIDKIILYSYFEEGEFKLYTLKIMYKNYNEYSIIHTRRDAMKWYWVESYRNQATNSEELEEDKELFRYMCDKAGKPVPDLTDWKGYEKYSSFSQITTLKPTDIIRFDYATT